MRHTGDASATACASVTTPTAVRTIWNMLQDVQSATDGRAGCGSWLHPRQASIVLVTCSHVASLATKFLSPNPVATELPNNADWKDPCQVVACESHMFRPLATCSHGRLCCGMCLRLSPKWRLRRAGLAHSRWGIGLRGANSPPCPNAQWEVACVLVR